MGFGKYFDILRLEKRSESEWRIINKVAPSLLAIILFALSACSNSQVGTGYTFPMSQKWVFHVGDDIYSVAVSSQGMAIAKPDGIVFVDVSNGAKIWEKPFPIDPDSEVYFADEFLIAQSPLQIYIIDKTGAEVKHIDLKSGFGDTANIISVFSNYIFMVRTPAWRLEVYDVNDTTLVWSANVGRGIMNIDIDPVSQTIYIASLNYIRAYDLNKGNLLWENLEWARTSVYDSGTFFYYGKVKNKESYFFSGYDINGLKTKWEIEFSPKIQTEVYNLTIVGNSLIAGTDNGLVAIDKSKGNQLWISEIDEIYAKPVLIDQVIYVKGASTYTVYAISPDDGRIIGKLQLEKASLGWQTHSRYVQGLQSLGKNLLITTSDTVYAYGSGE